MRSPYLKINNCLRKKKYVLDIVFVDFNFVKELKQNCIEVDFVFLSSANNRSWLNSEISEQKEKKIYCLIFLFIDYLSNTEPFLRLPFQYVHDSWQNTIDTNLASEMQMSHLIARNTN